MYMGPLHVSHKHGCFDVANQLAVWEQETFKREGLEYKFGGRTGSTLNSHRLIWFAGKEGPEKQDQVVEALFKAYFSEVRCS